MSTAQLLQVASESGVSTIKEATGDVAYFSRAVIGTSLPILNGDDSTYLASLAVGGEGIISVVANIFPKALVQLTDAFWRGDSRLALDIHNILMPTIDAMFYEVNPGPLKAALHAFGKIGNNFRLPLAAITPDNYARVKSAVETTKNQLVDFVK